MAPSGGFLLTLAHTPLCYEHNRQGGYGCFLRNKAVTKGEEMRGRLLCTQEGDARWYHIATVQDHGQSLAVVGLLERGMSTDQHVKDDTQAPDI